MAFLHQFYPAYRSLRCEWLSSSVECMTWKFFKIFMLCVSEWHLINRLHDYLTIFVSDKPYNPYSPLVGWDCWVSWLLWHCFLLQDWKNEEDSSKEHEKSVIESSRHGGQRVKYFDVIQINWINLAIGVSLWLLTSCLQSVLFLLVVAIVVCKNTE